MTYRPLLDLATPDLYRHNPFRVLGLSPRASTQEAHRAAKRKKMKGRLGMAASTFVGPGATTSASLTEAEIDRAMERLAHPTARLLDEIFWFWPTDSEAGADPTIDAWTQGQAETARRHWQTQTQRADLAPLATHNLAILDHLSALEREQDLSAVTGVEASQWNDLDALWKGAFELWERVIEDADFWQAIEARIRALNDAQLTTALVRPLRETLPVALSAINAKLAYAAAERGDRVGAQRQLGILRGSPFDDQVRQDALGEILNPLRTRVTTSCEQAKARWTASPHQANRHIRDLDAQVQPLLAIADCLLEQNDFARTGLHDLVAETMVEGETAFSNKTNDWQEGCALLALAATIAVGEPVREKIAKNIKINEGNIEAGNYWCSPGYWDLPTPTIEALEAARKKATAGDFDGAITALVVLDAAIDIPLRRCLAYALSIKGIRMVNRAMDDYNQETRQIKKIMDRLRGMDESRLRLTLVHRPNPNSSSYLNPPCLACGEKYYTSWVNFTYRDIPLFMCSECNAKDEREREERKRQIRKELTTALEPLLLASEIEQPADRGVARNLKQLRETAIQFCCPVPDTAELRRRLTSTDDVLQGTFGGIGTPATDAVCQFCNRNPASDSSSITVRLSSPIREVALLFGLRISFTYLDVMVPRCPNCRSEHRQLSERQVEWNKARDDAVADEQFPALLSELTAATGAVRASREKTEAIRRSVRQLVWLQGITLAAYPLAVFGVLLLGLQQLPDALYWGAMKIEEILRWNADESIQYLPVGLAFLIGPIIGWSIARRLHRGQTQRLQEAKAELASAIGTVKAATSTQKAVQSRLDTAKAAALATWRESHPMPELPANVKHEASYVDYPGIATRLGEGWSIGMHVGTAKAHEISRTSEHVSGLVAG